MTTKFQWKRVDGIGGPTPKPRHGHRAVAIKDLIIIFGGGNEGIVEDLNVYNCATNQWIPATAKGDVPPGCAAFGFATDGSKIVAFGGMIEYGKYSPDLWELNPALWQWKKIKARPPRTAVLPCARLGHTFTFADGKYYLFGGLANDSKDPKQNVPRYLNDLYTLECKGNNYSWELPITRGAPPSERESHTCVFYRGQIENRPKLLIYGGMNGHRLGDLWSFHLDFLQWTQITPSGLIPQSRSLHTAVIIGHRMFVFGGWVPLTPSDNKEPYSHEKEWKCTNTLASFNLETNTWELLGQECLDENVPRARAGHCAVTVNTRMYIWSGRDGYRKAWNNQVCCKDLWCLDTSCPGEPEKVQLVKAGIGNLEISWNVVPTADSYIVQIRRSKAPPEQPPTPITPVTPQVTMAHSSIPLQSISASLFASKSPQSVLASLIPTFTNDQQPSNTPAASTSDTDGGTDLNSSTATSINKSGSDLISLTHLSASQTPASSSISAIHTQTMSTVTPPTNSITNPTFILQKATPATVSSSIQYNHPTQTIRPVTSSNIQFVSSGSNTTSATIRPIIFHQKSATATNQPQLLTVMPAGVRVQQLTPVVRPTSNQPTTIVRLMTPVTSAIRPGTGQQQIIQLNTTKQPQQTPLVIKAITASPANRQQQQQQPILLATNTPQKTIAPQTQPQQVLLLNQNTFNNSNQITQIKPTVQTTAVDSSNTEHNPQETNNDNNFVPQLDGAYLSDDSTTDFNEMTTVEESVTERQCSGLIPQLDGSADEISLSNGTAEIKSESIPIQQPTNLTSVPSSTNNETKQSTTDNQNETPICKSETLTQTVSNDIKPSEDNDVNDGWNLVGTFKTTSTDIRHYYVVPSKLSLENYDLASLQAHNLVKKVELEPGFIYDIRIAAVNSCGRGPWSEAAAFKTCLPGLPPAPSNIKITKTPDGGAHLTWDPPPSGSSVITGYAVYLAVKNNTADATILRQQQQQASQMAFVRVYGGAFAECSVNAGQLLQAHLDTTSTGKPAIIFRIAARNERGYGPATQVRWLQDQQQTPTLSNNAVKRAGTNLNNNTSTAKKSRPSTGPGGAIDT